MIQFLTIVAAVFVGFLLIGVLLALLPKRKPALSCAFCGHEAHSLYDVVEHVKRCEKHPMKRELDGAVGHAKALIGQREKLRGELDAWWSIAKCVLEDSRNTLCDESRKLLEGIVKEGER